MFKWSHSLLMFVRCKSNLAEISTGPSSVVRGYSSIKESSNANARSLPINVEAIYHAPLRNPIQYGDLVADLQLRSYDHENLDFFADFIMRVGFYLGMPLSGPKPLPTRRERWTVIRAPFVHAKSKENFERHTHKRLIRAWDSNPEIVQMWLSYITKHSIAGVGAKCNIYHRGEILLEVNNTSDKSLTSCSTTADESHSNMDEAVGEKILELLNSEGFKKHL